MPDNNPDGINGLGRIDYTREEIEALVRQGRIMRARAIADMVGRLTRSAGRAVSAVIAGLRHGAGPGASTPMTRR